MSTIDFRVPGQREVERAERPVPVDLRCPYCKHQGAFVSVPSGDVSVWWAAAMASYVEAYGGSAPGLSVNYGVRQCPRSQCHGMVFVVVTETGVVLHTYPPETVDWDASNLPESVLATFEEAIVSEANSCYRASAIMTRRTLELVCADQGAGGRNLLERVKALGSKVVLPAPLLEGLDQLRLLGNDAAHLESKTYVKVGAEEARLALDIAKELLKAVYQLNDLVSRLQALHRAREGAGGAEAPPTEQ